MSKSEQLLSKRDASRGRATFEQLASLTICRPLYPHRWLAWKTGTCYAVPMDSEQPVALTVYTPKELRTRLRLEAARTGRTMSDIVNAAIEAALNAKEDTK